jgi:hypothetical protein
MRAAFVEGVPLVVRADYQSDWLVKGRERAYKQQFYRNHPDLMADANDIVSRPDERLGTVAMTTLEKIGRAVPLDIFGLDFDVDDCGRIVFFEANATMNLFSTAPTEFDYPSSADATLLQRIETLLDRRANPAPWGAPSCRPCELL